MPQESVQDSVAVTTGTEERVSAVAVAEFTHHHLNASLLTMKLAKKIEEDIVKCQNSRSIYSSQVLDYISFSTSSIISSVAALESNIQEILFYKDAAGVMPAIEQSNHKKSEALSKKYSWFDSSKSVIDQLKKKPSIIPKYEIIAFLLNGEFRIRNKKTKIEDAEYLIDIRNALIHFSPEVEAEISGRSFELKRHASIISSKKNRFSYSPLFKDDHVSFPNSIIHAGSAEWAYNTSNDFIKFYNETIINKWTSNNPS